MLTGLRDLLHYTWAMAIVGDIMKIRANDIGLGDIAIVEMPNGEQSLAQVIQLEGDDVSLQVFGGGKGLSTQTTVRFFGHPTQVIYSPNILGRVFRGDGTPIDGGPDLSGDRQVDIGGPSVNPVTRVVPMKMIRTNVPMIADLRRQLEREQDRYERERGELMALLREKEGNIKLLTGQTVQAKPQSWWTRLIGG
jgi:vacuolar-type H+-ATPase subunit B/Vma2